MVGQFLIWYLLLSGLGALAFPIAYRVFKMLPGRGFALARPLGLLLGGYLFWLPASLQIFQNDSGGRWAGVLLLAGLSLFAGRGQWKEMRAWLSERRGLVFTTEGLFLLLFAAWAVFRATNPAAVGTEKPMELAFINAILRSPTFPPHDPWLSGYAISYYHFGYILTAFLAGLGGIPGSVAFNLALSSWFALAGTAAYGVLYEILAERRRGRAHAWALLAPFFLLIVSNANGTLEMLHARGLFWQTGPDGSQSSSFWSWLDIQELTREPSAPYSWEPQRQGGIWWWRSSRVLTDYDAQGNPREIIDEFPAFSFQLADLHPHVLSMPFVLLAAGLALSAFRRGLSRTKKEGGWTDVLLEGEFWLAALTVGGLAFLNTWDFPVNVALIGGAYSLGCLRSGTWSNRRLADFVWLGLAGILLYLPFYFGFASQAGGLQPSLIFFTRGIHFWVMFGTLLAPVGLWMLATWLGKGWKGIWSGIGLAALLVFGLWALSFLVGWLVTQNPRLAGSLFQVQGESDPLMLFGRALALRLQKPGMWMSLLGILALAGGLLLRPVANQTKEEPPDAAGQMDWFVLLLVLLGCGLVLFPEFFYLRDQFGWRMNTIFKFYYQAWIIWSLAAGYASVRLWEGRARLGGWVARFSWVVAVSLGLPYFFFGLQAHIGQVPATKWTLDAAAYLQAYNPDEANAIAYLSRAPVGALAEAVGGSYSEAARVSTLSGQPAVLGWPGHESQWRGSAIEMGSREQDLQLLYRTSDWAQAVEILNKYDIRYVYVGQLEMSKYQPDEDKFRTYLKPVFTSQMARVYAVPSSLAAGVNEATP